MDDYKEHYSEESFWEKVKKFAVRAGREIIEKALALYYCLKDPATPAWAKGAIVGALGYFISPIDGIPDLVPVVGFSDDLGALFVASAIVGAHINSEHLNKARDIMRRLFGDNEEDVGQTTSSL